MQNKANFRKSQVNVSDLFKREYGQIDTWSGGKNKANSKPIQSQFKPKTKPIKPNFTPIASTPASTFCCGMSYGENYVV
jgi:hypothetical protein